MAPAKASSGKVRTPPGWVRPWYVSNSSKASPKNSDRPRRSARLVSSGNEVANDKGDSLRNLSIGLLLQPDKTAAKPEKLSYSR